MLKSLCSLESRSSGAQARRAPRQEGKRSQSLDGNFAAPKPYGDDPVIRWGACLAKLALDPANLIKLTALYLIPPLKRYFLRGRIF